MSFVERIGKYIEQIRQPFARPQEVNQAPPNTYTFLEENAKFFPTFELIPLLDGEQTDGYVVCMHKEDPCDDTRGSCMDFTIANRDGNFVIMRNIHVTDNDRIVRSSASRIVASIFKGQKGDPLFERIPEELSVDQMLQIVNDQIPKNLSTLT